MLKCDAFPGDGQAERRLALLIEGRRAERVIKLHWLREQQLALAKISRAVNSELRALRRELLADHGLDARDLATGSKPRPAWLPK